MSVELTDGLSETIPRFGVQKLASKNVPSAPQRWVIGMYMMYLSGLVAVYQWSGFTDQWAYQGFTDNFDSWRFLMAALAVLMVSVITPLACSVSSFSQHMALAQIVIPTLMLYACTGLSDWAVTSTLIGYGCLALGVRINVFDGEIGSGFIGARHLMWWMIGISFGTLVAIWSISGLRFFNLDIFRVYDFRRAAAADLPGVFAYLLSWTGKVFIPFVVVLGMSLKRPGVIGCGVGLAFLQLGFTAHKSPAFMPFLVILLFLLAKIAVRRPGLMVIWCSIGIVSLLSLSFMDFLGEIHSEIGTLLYRRMLLIPAQLNGMYIDVFGKEFDFYVFSHNRFTFELMKPPSELAPPNLIGLRFFNNADASANAGWIGAGYAQMGILGTAIYGVLVGIFCAVADVMVRRHGPPMVISILSMPLLAMISSSDFPTVLVNHGALLALLLLFCMRKSDHSSGGVALPLLRNKY